MNIQQLLLALPLCLVAFGCSGSGTTSTGPALLGDGGTDAARADGSGGGGGGLFNRDASSPADSGGSEPAGSAKCLPTVECVGNCPDNDDACIDKCINAAGPASQTAVAALYQCASNNSCTTSACIQQNCAAEIAACKAN